jgi:hypothetical protein
LGTGERDFQFGLDKVAPGKIKSHDKLIWPG